MTIVRFFFKLLYSFKVLLFKSSCLWYTTAIP